MTQFLRDEASDSEEVLTPLMLDGTYLSRNFATLGPFLTLQPPCVGYECRERPRNEANINYLKGYRILGRLPTGIGPIILPTSEYIIFWNRKLSLAVLFYLL